MILMLIRRFGSALRRAGAATSGQVAITFALALLPAILAIGSGIDLSRAIFVKMRLIQAMDAAGLAVGTTTGLTQAQMTDMAQRYFYANYPDAELGTITSFAVTPVTGAPNRFTVSATARVEATLMRVIGTEYIEFDTSVEITRDTKGLEVALVLDNTGSMDQDGKLTALKTSAKSLIDTLFGAETNPTRLKMAIVPFSQTVKVDKTLFLNNGWMDTAGASSSARLNFDNNQYAFSVWSSMSGQSWGGCLEARPNGLEELDTAPTVSQPDTLWVPYFEPDGPDATAYGGYTTYTSDGTTGVQDVRLRRSAKYAAKALAQPNSDCNLQQILPLTNSKTVLRNYIDGMIASGFTHVAIGAGWGWRVLSPGAPYTEGSAYGDANWQKVMILLTDGENTVPSNNTWHKSSYTAYNYLIRGMLGTTTSSTAETRQDELTALVCTRAKAAGVRVYSILLGVDTDRARNLMRDCATDPSLYFESPTTSQLQSVFSAIATDLSNLRLSK